MKNKKINYFRYLIILLDKHIFFNMIRTFYLFLKSLFFSTGITFSGWGMITYTNLPWQKTLNKESKE